MCSRSVKASPENKKFTARRIKSLIFLHISVSGIMTIKIIPSDEMAETGDLKEVDETEPSKK